MWTNLLRLIHTDPMPENEKNSGGRLILRVSIEHADDICEWIRDTIGKEPVEVSRPYCDDAYIEVYFDSPLEAELIHKALPSKLPIHSAETRIFTERDWTTFWQHHFKIMELGKHLRIVPEWEALPDDEKINIIINPGLSFGTGGHFTTRFCLEALEDAVEHLNPQSMIDAGTGSGILSIAAIKLGISDVTAFDHDPVCVEQCTLNAERNGVSGKIHFFQADVLAPGWNARPADLICANILTSVLLEAAPMLKRATRKRLLLSGIREIEADAVADTFIALGGREVSRDGDGQWCGLVIDV